MDSVPVLQVTRDSRVQLPGEALLHLAILYPGRSIRDVQVDIIEVLARPERSQFYLVRKTDLSSERERMNYWQVIYFPDMKDGTEVHEVYTIIGSSSGYAFEERFLDTLRELDALERTPSLEQLQDLLGSLSNNEKREGACGNG
jgi:hypothetical protein